ncbi:hypothetical protein M231_05592 [Tremella mesenterica]|uniref:Uncharacterized protein n=1 Tax=Tremella mesenterica TaxID=5217 RepID=A0A4Q1BHQ1_TREME|nr:hypothetical protein M231_05592 [Tremella mesenterica]
MFLTSRLLLTPFLALLPPLISAQPVLQTPIPSRPAPIIVPPTPLPVPTAADRIKERCDTCSGGEETLTAQTITTTIVTSIPCTVYVTDSTTITSYSTQTVSMTETVTQEGTVYVVHYQPTPLIMSTTYETVIPITETLTSMWVTSTGIAYDSTYTGTMTTVGGGSGSCNTCGSTNNSGSGWSGNGNGNGSGDQGSGNAWTHLSDGETVPATATGGVDVVGQTNNNAAGWATGTNVIAATGGTKATWQNAGDRRQAKWGVWMLAGLTMGVVLMFELRGMI